jgi:hypothetical protein
MERPSCTTCPHCITDSRSCARIYACNANRAAAKSGHGGGGGGHGGRPGPGGGGGGDPGSSDGNGSESSGRSRGRHQGRGDLQGNRRPGRGDPGDGDPGGDDPGDGDFPEVDVAGGDGRERHDGRADGWPSSNQKQRDREYAEFRKTALGQSGQSARTEFQSKAPGGIKLVAISYAIKMKVHFNASDPSVVRKQLIDLVADLHINLHGFNGSVPITVDEYDDFEEDVTLISNAVRDNAIVVTSRGPVTTLKFGVNPC